MSFQEGVGGYHKNYSTITNSFKACGICPFDKSAVAIEKLLPCGSSTEGKQTESSSENSDISSSATRSPSLATSSTVHIDAAPEVHVPVDVSRQLAEIEMELTNEKMALFERRYNNGFDVDVDPLYSQWKHLKDLSHTCPQQRDESDLEQSYDLPQKTPSPLATLDLSTSVSPVLKEVLKLPMLKNKKGKTSARTGTLHMPKHMTGDAFIDMMKEKEKKKQEEIEKKEKHKLERENKRKEREQLKLEKEQKKRKLAEKKQKSTKRSQKQNKNSQPNAASCESGYQCVECGELSDDEEWIECDNCDEWCHVLCSNVHDVSLEELKNRVWFCRHCQE